MAATTKGSTAHAKLAEIQQEVKVPKNLKNDFGGYKYRNAETILEAVKPLLGAASLVLSDDIAEVGGRIYVKATATLVVDGDSVSVSAFAREPLTRKGMDDSQITGSSSSYARKRCLEGFFLLDNSEHDPDASNTREGNAAAMEHALRAVRDCDDIDQLKTVCATYKAEARSHGWTDDLTAMFKARQAEILAAGDAGAGSPTSGQQQDGTSPAAPPTCAICGRPIDPMVGCDVCNAKGVR